MKIAIDFDGVIVERYGIPRKQDMMDCPPMENAQEAINFLRKLGHEVYILTNRDTKEVKEWIKLNEFPRLRVTNIKEPDTSVYIDDRAIRFTNWMDICKYFG